MRMEPAAPGLFQRHRRTFMSIRESINSSAVVGGGIAMLLIAIAVGIAYPYFHQPSILSHIGAAFFSDDDGQTYYRDSIYKFAPYDHGGKTAVMAMVYSDGMQNFVGYLMRFTPEAKQRLEDEYAKVQNGSETLDQFNTVLGSPAIHLNGTEEKLPGAGNQWVLRSMRPDPKVISPDKSPCWVVTP